MAITLSNSGITSGSIIKSSEVSQSIDAFAGLVAYDIHQSGSFNQTGSTVLSGSVFLPDNTHIGIGTTPSPTAGVKLALKANDSTNDPTILLEAFGATDSATIGWKNPDVRWNLGLSGGSADAFTLQNQTTNKFPILVDYSSSNNSIVLRNDTGVDLFQKVGINWPYGEMPIANPNHTLLVSGSITSSVGFYGDLIGTASVTDKTKVSNMISNATMPVLVMPGLVGNDYEDVMADPLYLNWDNLTKRLETTASWADNAVSSSYAGSASYVQISTASQASTSSVVAAVEHKILFGNDVGLSRINALLEYNTTTEILKAPNIISSGLISASGFTASLLDAVTSEVVNLTIAPAAVYSDRNQRFYMGNRSTGSDASMALIVGGGSSVSYSAMIINRHQELTFGNPGATFDYPLGYSVGEANSYAQFENTNNASSSMVAIKGASGADGILYLGGNNEYGGGILYHGNTLGSKLPGTFEETSTTIYRSSKSVAEPVMDFPTDNNHVMVRLDREAASDNLDYFGIGPTGLATAKPWKKTFQLNKVTTNSAINTSLGQISTGGVGVYSIKYIVGKCRNNSPMSESCVVEKMQNWRVELPNQNPILMISGTAASATTIEATDGVIDAGTDISSGAGYLQFNTAGDANFQVVHNGFVEVTYFPYQ
jgi:hypothetical protein